MQRRYSDFYKLAIEIKKWHTKTFRESLVSQFLKCEEEMKEFKETPIMEEYADCFIALSALAFRFDSEVGKVLWKDMVKNLESIDNDRIYRGIVHKFEVDKIRRFEKKGKVYRHIEEKQ